MSDFDDFFDTPLTVDKPQTNVSNSHNDVSPKTTPPSRKKSLEDSDNHVRGKASPRFSDSESNASYTDFSEESEADEKTTKQKIEAKVPSVGTYSEQSEDESPRVTNYKSDKHVSRVRVKCEKGRKESFSGGSGTDYSLSDTDSDVTDVSPLHTPHLSPNRKPGANYNKRPPKSPLNRKEKAPYYGQDGTDHLIDDSEKVDLNILMQAVLEMEKKNEGQYLKDERIARSRRVIFAPPKAKSHGRKNFSFSNDKVSTIDHENQRLMEKIVRMAVEGKKKQNNRVPKKKPVTTKMTPSAVNRLREQRKIEQENLAMLKRLQVTRASRGIKREDLLKDYGHKTIAGQSVAAAHQYQAPSPHRMHMINNGNRSQSMSDVQGSASVVLQDRGFQYRSRASHAVTYVADDRSENASVVLQSKRQMRPTSASTTHSFGTRGSRPSSAKQRPKSAHTGSLKKQSSVESKPEWDSAW